MTKPAQVTEKLVKDKIRKVVDIFGKYNPIYTLTPMTMGYGESGHPDRLLLINDKLIGIEAKKDKNNHHTRPELKPKSNEVMQKRQAEKIRNAGGEWICVHNENIGELVQLLNKYALVETVHFDNTDVMTIKKLLGA